MSMKNGIIQKTAQVAALTCTAEELEKINAFALEPLTVEDVYCFKIAVVSNAQDVDRDEEPLLLNAVKQLAAHLKGRTVLFDHNPTAKNQFARIYDTILETKEAVTDAGEPLTTLIAHCYMVKTAANADLITEIKAGIKKEVSVGMSTSGFRCSICGKDFNQCVHRKRQTYDGKTCRAMIVDCIDAYEVSFVAVPCQRDAGTTKSFEKDTSEQEAELKVRIRLYEKLYQTKED